MKKNEENGNEMIEKEPKEIEKKKKKKKVTDITKIEN